MINQGLLSGLLEFRQIKDVKPMRQRNVRPMCSGVWENPSPQNFEILKLGNTTSVATFIVLLFYVWLEIGGAKHPHTCQLSRFSRGSPSFSSGLPVRAPNLPGNTYRGFFLSLISLFSKCQKGK